MCTSFDCERLHRRKTIPLLKGVCGCAQRRSRRGILILLKFCVGYIFHLIAQLVPDANKHMAYSIWKIILTFTSLWTAVLHFIRSNLPETASLVIMLYELTPLSLHLMWVLWLGSRLYHLWGSSALLSLLSADSSPTSRWNTAPLMHTFRIHVTRVQGAL